MESLYAGQKIVLTTKHRKADGIAHVFRSQLGAEVVTIDTDTDLLGTFSGEIARQGTSVECAKKKCELGLQISGLSYGISSEGSFGPHPQVPFFPCGIEILYFIDHENEFELHLSQICERTNYRTGTVKSVDELFSFAYSVGFPSHALIVRPDEWTDKTLIFKGIQTDADLSLAFNECSNFSDEKRVWVETDMRAHMNPTRMQMIEQLACDLATRLHTRCPACSSPGWGVVGNVKGLPCELCNFPTEYAREETLGCARCPHKIQRPRSDGMTHAPAKHCSWCNP